MTHTIHTDPQSAPMPRTPFRGWAWRGANLDADQLAVFTPDIELKHLGEGRACVGPLTAHAQVFRIYAHRAWLLPGTPVEIVFPENTLFRVREISNLGEKRICILLEQCIEDCGWHESLQHEFDAWRSLGAEAHAQPDPARVEAWNAPFACWAPEAVPGDGPITDLSCEGGKATENHEAPPMHEGHLDSWKCILRDLQIANAKYST